MFSLQFKAKTPSGGRSSKHTWTLHGVFYSLLEDQNVITDRFHKKKIVTLEVMPALILETKTSCIFLYQSLNQ